MEINDLSLSNSNYSLSGIVNQSRDTRSCDTVSTVTPLLGKHTVNPAWTFTTHPGGGKPMPPPQYTCPKYAQFFAILNAYSTFD